VLSGSQAPDIRWRVPESAALVKYENGFPDTAMVVSVRLLSATVVAIDAANLSR
jgi:hypothetical protein